MQPWGNGGMLKILMLKLGMKQKIKKQLLVQGKSRLKSLALLAMVCLLVFGATVIPDAGADSLDDQIRALQQQNTERQNSLSGLRATAMSFEDEIDQLQGQINATQRAIDESTAKQAELQAKIEESQRELDRQRQVLGAGIRAMYVDGDISTIEMLATSRDLSEFFDKEAYRNSVQDKIQETLKKVAALQEELKGQKAEVERLLQEQQVRRSQLAASRNEQNRLLTMNKQEQAAHNQKIKENSAKIAELQAEQIRINCAGGKCVAGVPGGGGYQWGDASCIHRGAADPPCGEYDWGYASAAYPRNILDNWGYGYRNCTSWVAFKLSLAGKRNFSNLGNAKQWKDNVPDSWVSYGGGARVGDAAVSTGGRWGHVRYVERVNSDGTISYSDYNRGGDGYYRGPDFSGSTVSQAGLYFIHFPE